jgi:hypothetical protein
VAKDDKDNKELHDAKLLYHALPWRLKDAVSVESLASKLHWESGRVVAALTRLMHLRVIDGWMSVNSNDDAVEVFYQRR